MKRISTALAVLGTLLLCAVPSVAMAQSQFGYPNPYPWRYTYPHAKYGYCFTAVGYGMSVSYAGLVTAGTTAIRVNWCSVGRHISWRSISPYEKTLGTLEFKGWDNNPPSEMWISDQYGGAVDAMSTTANYCAKVGVGSLSVCVRNFRVPIKMDFSGTLFWDKTNPNNPAAYFWDGVHGWQQAKAMGWYG